MTAGSTTLADLFDRFRRAWSAGTSSRWREDNPACGQCGVTALVVHDLLGGDILKTDVNGAWHFYNRIGETRIDFTMGQFDSPIGYADLPSSREEAFGDCSRDQYELLRGRVTDAAARRTRDSDRPPVLAHTRFVAERSAFAGLDLAGRFRRIHQNNLWGAAGSVSGVGSESRETQGLRRELPRLLQAMGVTSLLDCPCGDGGWISDLDLGVSYTGVDIVPDLIDDLRGRAKRAGGARTYLLADITSDSLPRADAILCRDCLVHLSFANIAAAIANFSRSGCEWLITTTFPDLGANADCEDGDWRALNFELAPFAWGRPAHLLVEGCTEGDGGWADKSLGVWQIARLPPTA